MEYFWLTPPSRAVYPVRISCTFGIVVRYKRAPAEAGASSSVRLLEGWFDQPHSFIVFIAASASACDLYSPIIL